MVRQGENAIRHSRLLVERMEAEADRSPERRDRLLDAARSVAQATSRMIDATKVLYHINYLLFLKYILNFAMKDLTSGKRLKLIYVEKLNFMLRNVKCIHKQLNLS